MVELIVFVFGISRLVLAQVSSSAAVMQGLPECSAGKDPETGTKLPEKPGPGFTGLDRPHC